jgi:hypothetical protein
VWWCSFGAFALLGVVWCLTIPLAAGPDEPNHAIRATAVARGQLDTSTRDIVGGRNAIIPATDVQVPGGYSALNVLALCYENTAGGGSVPCARTHQVRGDGPTTAATTYVGSYQPVYYALVGWPSRLVELPTALYAMRLIGALVAAALLASGLTSAVAIGRRRFLVVAATVGITPMVMFLFGVVNANGLEIAAAFCVWLSVLELLTAERPLRRRVLLRAGVSSVLLAWCRPLSPVFLIVILGVVGLIALDRRHWRSLWDDRRARLAGGVVALATVASLAFVVVNQSLNKIIKFPVANPPSTVELAHTSLTRTGLHVEQMVGTLGWISFQPPKLPPWLVDGWELAVVALVVVAVVAGTGRQRVVLVATVVGVIGLPVASDALAGAQYGTAWQGRYALPLAVGMPILAGWIIDTRLAVSDRLVRWGAIALAVLVPAGLFVALASVIAQAVDGNGTSWTRAFGAEPWIGPVGPGPLLAAGLLGTVALGAWLVVLARGWPPTAATTDA